MGKGRTNASKPLPLKQRTSSVDARRDYNAETWYSVLGLLKLREFFITVDHFSIWRRHLAWSMENGKSLRDYMTQRYASSMVFMSLLLSTEINILFNSSPVPTNMRSSLQNEEYWKIEFWIGIVIILSAVLTLLSLISTYTTWSMVSSVHENNAHCIFRSSIGQYVAELPGRLVVFSIYTFLLWIMMCFFVLLPVGYWSIALATFSLLLFAHTICVFSAFGRIIMHTGAMGDQRVFEQAYEKNLLPHSLHAHLLAKARVNLSKHTSILRQYRSNARPIDHLCAEDELYEYMYHKTGSEDDNSSRRDFRQPRHQSCYGSSNGDSHYFDTEKLDFHPAPEPRRRTDSTVRFADEIGTVTTLPSIMDPRNITTLTGQEANSLVSLLSAISSSGDIEDNRRTEESAKSSLQNQPTEADSSRPSRPALVQRDQSHTTAPGSDFVARPESQSQKASASSKKPSPLPPTHNTSSQKPTRAESDGGVTCSTYSTRDWLATLSRQRDKNANTKRFSTGSLPPAPLVNVPGLSVLENAAKLQRQWRNSGVERGSRELAPSPPPLPRPITFRESELWVKSSMTILRKDFPNLQQGDSFEKLPTSAMRNDSPVPPRNNIFKTSSADGLSSGGSNSLSAETIEGTALSQEEEEAYLADYGSFEQLPELEVEAGHQTEHLDAVDGTTEAASLLHHARLLQHHNQSYMAVDYNNQGYKTLDWKKLQPK